MIPKGVTIRKMGEPPRPIGLPPRNDLESAALQDSLDAAKTVLAFGLRLNPDSPLAQIHLSEPARWARISPCTRLMEIAAWLKAECYEAMDLVESAAVDTKGD